LFERFAGIIGYKIKDFSQTLGIGFDVNIFTNQVNTCVHLQLSHKLLPLSGHLLLLRCLILPFVFHLSCVLQSTAIHSPWLWAICLS